MKSEEVGEGMRCGLMGSSLEVRSRLCAIGSLPTSHWNGEGWGTDDRAQAKGCGCHSSLFSALLTQAETQHVRCVGDCAM